MPSDSLLLTFAGIVGGLFGAYFAMVFAGAPRNPGVVSETSQKTCDANPHSTILPPDEALSRTSDKVCLSNGETCPPASEGSAHLIPTVGPHILSQSQIEIDVYSTLSWRIGVVTQSTLDLCTTGDGFACLGLGEFYSEQAADPNSRVKSRAYYERAFAILVLKCNHREPDSCVAIAHMHRVGRGLRKSPTAEKALIDRARELCRSKPGLVCPALAHE